MATPVAPSRIPDMVDDLVRRRVAVLAPNTAKHVELLAKD